MKRTILILFTLIVSNLYAWTGSEWRNDELGTGIIEKVEFFTGPDYGYKENVQIKFKDRNEWWIAARSQFFSDAEYNRLIAIILLLKNNSITVEKIYRVNDFGPQLLRSFTGFRF